MAPLSTKMQAVKQAKEALSFIRMSPSLAAAQKAAEKALAKLVEAFPEGD